MVGVGKSFNYLPDVMGFSTSKVTETDDNYVHSAILRTSLEHRMVAVLKCERSRLAQPSYAVAEDLCKPFITHTRTRTMEYFR